MSVMQTVITVVAALAGTVLGTLLKRRADKDGRDHEWHVKILEYSARLAYCFSRHRAAMWDLEAARLKGDQDEMDAALAASLVTRDAITEPEFQLTILVPQLETQISWTAQTIYAIDTATDPAGRTQERLDERLAAAKDAIGDLVTAMTALMRKLGAGLPDNTGPARRRARAAARIRRLIPAAVSRGKAITARDGAESEVDPNRVGVR